MACVPAVVGREKRDTGSGPPSAPWANIPLCEAVAADVDVWVARTRRAGLQATIMLTVSSVRAISV